MKKLNQKGFTHLEITLVILVLVVIIGAGFFVLNRGNNQDNKTSNTAASTEPKIELGDKKPAPELELKEYKNDQYGFSFKYPSSWSIGTNMKDIGRGGDEGTITITSPYGTKIQFAANYGGRGGSCADEKGALTAISCPTFKSYIVEKVQATSMGQNPVYFYQASLTESTNLGGKTAFGLFISNNAYYGTEPKSILGAIFTPDIQLRNGEVTVTVGGKDSPRKDSKAYFDTTEAKEATPVLKSFKSY